MMNKVFPLSCHFNTEFHHQVSLGVISLQYIYIHIYLE